LSSGPRTRGRALPNTAQILRHWTKSTTVHSGGQHDAVHAGHRLGPGDEFFVGANKKKPKPGEELLFIEKPLLDPITNVRVGSFNARLKVMKNSGGAVLFSNNADNELQGRGVISTQGPLRTNQAKNVFAIVGGTRQFDKARGTVTVQTVNNKEQVTFDLS
jgi:hypothetical protein